MERRGRVRVGGGEERVSTFATQGLNTDILLDLAPIIVPTLKHLINVRPGVRKGTMRVLAAAIPLHGRPEAERVGVRAVLRHSTVRGDVIGLETTYEWP